MQQQAERRWGLSIGEKAELWARWKAGESMSDIGRVLGKQPGSIFTFLAVQGGIARPPRRRAVRALTAADREQISRGLAADRSIRAIATPSGSLIIMPTPMSAIAMEVVSCLPGDFLMLSVEGIGILRRVVSGCCERASRRAKTITSAARSARRER